jgi:hypothetical protein
VISTPKEPHFFIEWLVGLWFVLFDATFNNISVISWQSVLLLAEETGVSGENQRPIASHWQTLSHNVVSSTSRHEWGSNSQLLRLYALIAHLVVNPTTIRSRARRPSLSNEIKFKSISMATFFRRIFRYSDFWWKYADEANIYKKIISKFSVLKPRSQIKRNIYLGRSLHVLFQKHVRKPISKCVFIIKLEIWTVATWWWGC